MKKVFTLLLTAAVFPMYAFTQCQCPPTPQNVGIVDTVATVTELQGALTTANANNGNYTILLEDGTYQLNSNLLYINTTMENLVIRGLSGDRDAVVVKGQGYNGNVTHIFNVAAKNFVCADMTIGWVANHAIQIHAENDADNPVVQNVRFVDVQEQMLKVSGSASSSYSDNGLVECCLFEFTDSIGFQWYTGGIDGHRCRDWVVRNNVFKHIRSPEANLAEHAIHFWSFSENTLVENNRITNCDRGIGFGLGSNGHHGGMIRNNYVHTTRDVGIGLETADSVSIFNNSVFTENYFNSIEYRFAASLGNLIYNNITNKNIAQRNDGEADVQSNYTAAIPGIFANATEGNLALVSFIPQVMDAGMALPEVAEDFDCEIRPMGSGMDIGADEFTVATSLQQPAIGEAPVSIYPNPVSAPGNLWFKNIEPLFGHDEVQFQLMTLAGQQVFSSNLTDRNVRMPWGLKSGLYIYKVKKEEVVLSVGKLLVVR